jgi:hypothetical protein
MDNQLHQALLTEIGKKFAKKTTMVNALAEILRIEKGAVYRRLREEVPFTFNEIALIAKNLMISLDNLIGIEEEKSIPFQMRLMNFMSPKEIDYYTLNSYIAFIRSINQSENSEMASVYNVLPQELSTQFYYIILFDFFKWNFHYNNDRMKPFHQLSIPEGMKSFQTEYAMEMKNFKKANYVLDNRIFRLVVDDIHYFNSIRLIEKNDILKIKEALLSILDYIEKMAITGQFRETGNAVNLYISDVDITTSYVYYDSGDKHFSMIRTFLLSSVNSIDENTFDKMKKWIQSLIKISTLITLTNERQRVLYFEKQRKIINEI